MKRTLCTALLFSAISTLVPAQAQQAGEGNPSSAAAPSPAQGVPVPPNGNQPTIPAGGFPAEIPANAPLQGGHDTSSSGSSHKAAVESADQAFLDTVEKSASAEVIASTMELQHTGDTKMEAFAKQLLADSSEIAQTVRPLAASKKISLPAGMSNDDRGKLQGMHDLDPSAMDREYAKLYGKDTQKNLVDLFSKTASEAKDADIKTFASNNLPKLKADLAAAQKLPAS